MSAKQHVVRLSAEDRAALGHLIRRDGASALQQRRARILLLADVGQEGRHLTDREVAAAAAVDVRTVARVRTLYAVGGPDGRGGLGAVLAPRPRADRGPGKLDGTAGVALTALACTEAPAGHARWTLRLLAARLVALEVVDGVSPETVRAALKKTTSSRGCASAG